MVTPGQVFEMFGNFANRVNWASLDKDRLQEEVIKQPDRAASEFERFLRNGARVMVAGNMKVGTAPFDPVAFIGKGWSIIPSIIPEEQDVRSAALAEVDVAEVEFLTCLESGENWITGEEKLTRLKKENRIRYGATVFAGLWQDYQTRKENSMLERLYQEKGITYLDFFGDVFLSPDGSRRVLCLARGAGGVWHWRRYWLDGGWHAGRVSVVSPQVFCD